VRPNSGTLRHDSSGHSYSWCACLTKLSIRGYYNTYNAVAQNLIIDSMAYWIGTLGVDGFRFDLGVVLGNACLNGAAVGSVPTP